MTAHHQYDISVDQLINIMIRLKKYAQKSLFHHTMVPTYTIIQQRNLTKLLIQK